MRRCFVTNRTSLILVMLVILLAGCELAVMRLPGGSYYVGVTVPTPAAVDPTPTREIIRQALCNVTGDAYNIRDMPQRGNNVVGLLDVGECVEVDTPLIIVPGEGYRWVQVFDDGLGGWVVADAFGL